MINDYSTLKVDDEVAVFHHGSWTTHSEGAYIVAKADKMKVVLKRKGDGYERTFSVKTRLEKGATKYHSPMIETIAEMQARNTELEKERNIRDAWTTLKEAVSQKNIAAAEAALAHIQLLTS